MTTDPALDADANSDEEFVEDDDAALEEEIPDIYDVQTERLKVYATLLRVTVPRIGATTRVEFGKEAEIDPDVCSARNLAIMAIFADIRRIAGFEERDHPPNMP